MKKLFTAFVFFLLIPLVFAQPIITESFVFEWVKFFLLTLSIEGIIFLFLWSEGDWKQKIGTIFIVNLLAHPALFFGYRVLFVDYWIFLVTGTAVTIVVEAFIINLLWRKLYFYNALGVSFVMNVASILLGLVLSIMFPIILM